MQICPAWVFYYAQYKYDVVGNLLSVTLPSGTLIEYIIDGS